VTNVPIAGKQVDALINFEHSGLLKIDFFENENIIDSKIIKIV
jgi:hypothetical protein